MKERALAKGEGVRRLSLSDQLPACAIAINRPIYNLGAICENRDVVDIGCGVGWTRPIVEASGGHWVGIEPFKGGAHTVTAKSEHLPFRNASFDLVIMNAVLEHLQEVEESFAEVARILRPGGQFVGYAAFMECFHEISYHHLSFRGLEYLASKHGMALRKLGGGGRFGIDHHLSVLLYPIPTSLLRNLIAASIRSLIRAKAIAATLYLVSRRGVPWAKAQQMGHEYYTLECLRQSNGFDFIIEKPIRERGRGRDGASAPDGSATIHS
jgi:SAM-dependent methyltransferase